MFPLQRPRRLRSSDAIRSLVRENHLGLHDLLTPLFVMEGGDSREPIPSMPGQFRLGLTALKKEVKELNALGLKAVLLFAKIPEELKDPLGTEALNAHGLMQRAITTVKEACPEMVVFTDVALDPYSSHGHDGIVQSGYVVNDHTVEVLAQMALSHARAGADVIAPSDMMDGRILRIREALESGGFHRVSIMSYTAKYSSAFYGPFREALDSAPVDLPEIPTHKGTYQMDIANRREALREAFADLEEGADILMVKPGLAYLDIVSDLRRQTEAPIAVYQVSGEYAMVHAAAERGWLDLQATMLEQLMAFKRAGADIVATYFARECAHLL